MDAGCVEAIACKSLAAIRNRRKGSCPFWAGARRIKLRKQAYADPLRRERGTGVSREFRGSSTVEMEDLVHDFPLAVDFQQREKIRESIAGPIVRFNANGGDCFGNVDGHYLTDDVLRRPSLVRPIVEALYRSCPEI